MESQRSILMFPWLGHGHISPFLELAKQLQPQNFKIYLCSTPANLSSIRPRLNHIDHTFPIQFIQLHLPNLPNLPPQYHTTNALPPYLMNTLKQAFDMSQPNFEKILKKLQPDLLIYDCLQPWSQEIASSLRIPAIQFVTSSATMTCLTFHTLKNPVIKFPFDTIYYREYEEDIEVGLLESVEMHKRVKNPVLESFERSNEIVLIKGFKEIEEKYGDYLSVLTGKRVVWVGPLVQEPMEEDDWVVIDQWLNKKEKGSTVFVSFGSEYFLSREDFVEIANGLLLSGLNFIWVVRFPKGENIKVDEELPLGFVDKVRHRGLVLEGWAPQAKILGHTSVGGFVSHCGWNSVMEGMSFGVPIIAMPMQIDQPINARLVEEVGAGIEVVRNKKGNLEREKIASVMKEVVLEAKGEVVRKKVKELSNKIKMKGNEEIDVVVEELMELIEVNGRLANGAVY